MNRCACCDIELTASRFHGIHGTYCCAGCAEGGPCRCAYTDHHSSRSGNGHADPVVTWALLGDTDRLEHGLDSFGAD